MCKNLTTGAFVKLAYITFITVADATLIKNIANILFKFFVDLRKTRRARIRKYMTPIPNCTMYI